MCMCVCERLVLCVLRKMGEVSFIQYAYAQVHRIEYHHRFITPKNVLFVWLSFPHNFSAFRWKFVYAFVCRMLSHIGYFRNCSDLCHSHHSLGHVMLIDLTNFFVSLVPRKSNPLSTDSMVILAHKLGRKTETVVNNNKRNTNKALAKRNRLNNRTQFFARSVRFNSNSFSV